MSEAPRSGPDPEQVVRLLVQVGRDAHARGWALGTSGNFSAVLGREPLRVAITATGVDKAALAPEHILEVDAAGRILAGAGRPSEETALHLAVVRTRGAGAVLHTHSIWSTLLSDAAPRGAGEGGVALEGYEMLKGLAGVRTHAHREWLPVLDNDQDAALLARAVESTLARHQAAHGLLLRRHGLYTWGADLSEARRHLEILEFLLEVAGRRGGAWPS